MGIYDSIYFLCPVCNESIEVQIKHKDHGMATFDCHEVPTNVAVVALGDRVYCDKCHGYFKVRKRKREVVELELYDPLL